MGCWTRTAEVETPASAQYVFEGDRRLWANHPLRVVTAAGWRVAIAGGCAAETGSLERLVARIARGHERVSALCGLGGSYHVIIDDGQAFTAVGDLAGLRQLFTAEVNGTEFFASSPQPLSAMLRRQPDTQWLAAQLFCADAQELHERSTAYAGIARIPAGWQLRCTRAGMTTATRDDFAMGRHTMSEAAEALKTALQQSVALRARRNVSADLSGGLDSTSLAVLATSHGPLRAITYVDPLAGGDEDVVFAQKIAVEYPSVDHTLVHGDLRTVPYASIDPADIAALDEPSQDLLIAARTRARLAPAAGSAAHLVGDGGDVVLTGPLIYLADLALAGHFRALVRETAALARLRHRPKTSVLRSALRCAASTYHLDLYLCAQRLSRHARGDRPPQRQMALEASLVWARLSAAASWATASVAHDLSERLRELIDGDLPEIDTDAMALRAIRWHGSVTRQAQRLAASWGVNLQAPFFDDPVVAACTSVPVSERTSAYAAKPLLGRAMSGLVPAEVLARRSKGDYTASEYAGLRAAAPHLFKLLRDPLLADLGLIEPSAVARTLQDAVDGQTAPLGALADVLATEIWLRAVHNAELTSWTTSGVAR